MISRYIGLWGCCACTLLAFPALALSTLTCMRRAPSEKPPRNLLRGGFGQRSLLKGFVVRVGLTTFTCSHGLVRPFTIETLRLSQIFLPCPSPQTLIQSLLSTRTALVTATSQQTLLCTHHRTAAIGKTSFACVMSAHPLYIFMYPCLGSYRETGWGACSTEFS